VRTFSPLARFHATHLDVVSEQALQTILEDAGINTQRFGVDQAKSLLELYHELAEGSSHLQRTEDACLNRIVEPVFIELRWRDRVLMNTQKGSVRGKSRDSIVGASRCKILTLKHNISYKI